MSQSQNILKIIKSSKSLDDFSDKLNQHLSNLNEDIKGNINYNLFDKDKMGRSGAQIGKYGNSKVIKIYNTKIDKTIKLKYNCVFVSSIINEIIINSVLNNLDKFSKISIKDYNLVKNHIVKLYNYELTNNKQYLIMKKIGVNDTYNNKYYTNMTELIIYNHIPWLVKNIYNTDLIKNYDLLMTNKFDDYFKALRVLHKHIKYINTDNKLNNIFIDKDNNTNNKKISSKINNKTKRNTTLNKSRNSGNIKNSSKTKKRDIKCITNFKMMITDLDKANININNITILPIKYSGLKKKFDPLRYTCHNYQFKNCKKLNVFEYDILMCIMNLLILFKKTEKQYNINIIDNLPKLMNLFQNQFTFSKSTFDKINNFIDNHKFIINIKKEVSTKLLTYLIIKFCKYIE